MNKQKKTKIKKILIFINIIAIILFSIYGYFSFKAPTSRQAFINTRLVKIKSPISGQLNLLHDIKQGDIIKKNNLIGTIHANSNLNRVSELKILIATTNYEINELEAEKERIETRILQIKSEILQFKKESKKQKKLQYLYTQNKIYELENILKQEKVQLNLNALRLGRTNTLYPHGAISQEQLDIAKANVDISQAKIRSRKAEIAQLKNELEANKVGLSIKDLQTISKIEELYREKNTLITELVANLEVVKHKLNAKNIFLNNIENNLNHIENINLFSNTNDNLIVWSIPTHSGSLVREGDLLISLIDCRDIWIDAYVDDSVINKIKIGSTVSIKIKGFKNKINGTVESIMSGLGRVNTGDDLAIPPPEILRRQLPIKVSLVKIKLPVLQNVNFESNYCLAGRSADVIFK